MVDTKNTIRFDSVGAEKVKRDYADITAANDKTAAGFQKTGVSAAVAGTSVDKLGKATSDYAARANVAASSSNSFAAGLASMARYAAAGAVGLLGTQAIRSADQYRVLQGRIAEATRSTGDFATVSRSLYDISQRTGTALESNVALFQRMAIGAREFGAANPDILKVTESVQKLGIIGGASAASIAAGTLQLAQGMSAGVLRAEEFNSVVENLPEVAQAIAKGMGMTVGQLRQAVLDGKVLSVDVFGSILDQSQEIQERFDAVPTSLAQATQKLSDAFSRSAGESKGLIETIGLITDGIELLGQNMDEFFQPLNDFIRTTVKEFRALYGVMQDILGLVGVDVPDLASGGAQKAGYNGGPVLVTDRTFKRDGGGSSEKEMAKAAKQAEEWQDRVADGWRDMYDKVGEASADFYTKLGKDVQDAISEEDKAQQERRANIKEMIDDLALETDMIGLSNKERERRVGLMRLEKQNASADDIARFNAGIDAKYAREAAQDAADEVKAVWDSARDDFSDAWSDLFYGIFNDGKLKFKDLADSIKSIWARTLADLLTLSIQNSFIKPMFDGLFGGMMGTGAAGTRSAISALGGNSLQGTGGIFGPAPGGVPDPTLGGGSGGGLFGGFKMPGWATSAIGGGLMGMGLGSITGSGTGGALGGALGSFLGPVGGLVGGLLGGFIGSLFKSTPRSISGVTTNGMGIAGLGDSYAQGLDIKIGQGMGKSVANLLNEFASELDLSLDSGAFVGLVGQRGKKFFFQSQQSDIKKAGKGKYGAVKFDSAEEAIAAAVEAALQQGIIDGLTEADKKLLEAASSVQEGMAKVIDRRNFIKELDFQYMGLTDPLGEQLARLKDWYDEQLKLAEEYEADKTKLEAVYNAKRKDLIEQYNESLYGGLKDFLTSITAGSASTLSPTTRLGLASANYSALVAKAKAGDENAIGALQGAAQDYLTAGRDVFASSSGYQSIYQRVVADLSSITGMANPLTGAASSASNLASAVNDNMRTQITFLSTAQSQRAATNEKLDTLNANFTALVSALSRGSALPTQNGTVTVGAVDWSSITQAVASMR